MNEESKKKIHCPICDAEIDEDEVICPECGSYIQEPAYDAIDDEDESEE
jgi:predicted nucleic acid-binding Zn ribbon protein